MTQSYTSHPSTTNRGGNGLAIAALVCGIVGLFVFAIILGPLALILGLVALNKAKRGAGHRGLAIAGVVLGVVDIALFLVVLLAAANGDGGAFGVTFG